MGNCYCRRNKIPDPIKVNYVQRDIIPGLDYYSLQLKDGVFKYPRKIKQYPGGLYQFKTIDEVDSCVGLSTIHKIYSIVLMKSIDHLQPDIQSVIWLYYRPSIDICATTYRNGKTMVCFVAEDVEEWFEIGNTVPLAIEG